MISRIPLLDLRNFAPQYHVGNKHAANWDQFENPRVKLVLRCRVSAAEEAVSFPNCCFQSQLELWRPFKWNICGYWTCQVAWTYLFKRQQTVSCCFLSLLWNLSVAELLKRCFQVQEETFWKQSQAHFIFIPCSSFTQPHVCIFFLPWKKANALNMWEVF